MEDKILHQLKLKKIWEFKNPVIVLNEKDFVEFIKQIKEKVRNFEVVKGSSFFMGIPIQPSSHIEKGNIIVFDKPMLK